MAVKEYMNVLLKKARMNHSRTQTKSIEVKIRLVRSSPIFAQDDIADIFIASELVARKASTDRHTASKSCSSMDFWVFTVTMNFP